MWGLNLGVQACQKNFKPFQHRNAYASIYLVYKRNFLIYINITVGFKKIDSDEKKLTVMLVITVGLF